MGLPTSGGRPSLRLSTSRTRCNAGVVAEAVTVALVGDPKRWGDEFVPEAGRKPWDERLKVDIELRDEDTWATVIDRAAEELGVELPQDFQEFGPVRVSDRVPYVAFYREGAERPLDSSPRSQHVTLVDDDGRARWNVPLPQMKDLPYSELIRAGEHGALEGDPRRMYLFPTFGIGNGMLPNWASWVQALGVLWQTVQAMADVEGGLSFSKRALDTAQRALGRTKAVEERHHRGWAERGLTPIELDSWLGDRPWNPDDLAFHLDCSAAEAEAVLVARGFAQDEAGLWRRSDEEAADFLRRATAEIELAYNLDYNAFEGILQRRIKHFILEGKRATVPGGYSPDDLPSDSGDLQGMPSLDELPLSDDADMDRDDFDRDEIDKELEEDIERMRIPVEILMLRCGCQKQDCCVAATFGVANGQLKVGFTGQTDHFVVAADYISRIAEQIGDDIYKARKAQDKEV